MALSLSRERERESMAAFPPTIVIFYKRLGVTEISALSRPSHMSWKHATEAGALGLL